MPWQPVELCNGCSFSTRACLIIGVTAFIASAAGYIIGNRSGRLLGRWAEVLAEFY
jgi:putative Mn2+ efflux pump MntP